MRHHHTTTLARRMTGIRETREAFVVDADSWTTTTTRSMPTVLNGTGFLARGRGAAVSRHAAMLLSCCLHVCNAVVVLSLMCVCTSTALTI